MNFFSQKDYKPLTNWKVSKAVRNLRILHEAELVSDKVEEEFSVSSGLNSSPIKNFLNKFFI